MKHTEAIPKKIHSLPDLLRKIAQVRILGQTIAFTNGCFDILHPGHIASLSKAAEEADFLVVGVNADPSVRRLGKGPDRPVQPQEARALLLASLQIVDAVIIFEEDTPLQLIEAIRPDVLVKGGDYRLEDIVGAREVMSWGGRVVINPILPGNSTTAILQRIHGGS